MTEFGHPPTGSSRCGPDDAGRNGKIVLKLHQESNVERNNVTAYGPDYVEVNKERHTSSLLLFPEGPVVPWPVSRFDALSAADFELLAQAAPELVIFGSGQRLRFAHPRFFAALSAQRIGVETMDFTAACRTFNILVSEGRRVAAALLIETD